MKAVTQLLLAGLLLTLLLPARVEAQRTGVEIWAQTCGNCHVTQPADRYTAERWVSIMTHMRIYSRLTDTEADLVLQFLQGGSRSLQVGATASASNESSASDAGKNFGSYCVPCHGAEGAGNGPAAAVLNPRPANFTDPEFQQSRTNADLTAMITEGKGTMPGFKNQLTAAQIRALVDYIRGLEKNR